MTPTELRAHAAACCAIADVLEQLADLAPLRARDFGPSHEPPFLLE